MGFDPDKYIAEKTSSVAVPKSSVDFDPNAYIESKTAPVDQDKTRAQALKDMNADIGLSESFAIGAGKGMYDIGRATGLVEPEDPIVTEAFKGLQEQNPISTEAGKISGQVAPFLLPGTAVGAIPNIAARVGAATVLGLTEGGLIAKSEGKNVAEGATIGGVISGGMEVIFPVISRVGGALIRKVTGKSPKGSIINQSGQPSPELVQALEASGLSMNDLTTHAIDTLKKAQPGSNPEQAARLARLQSLDAPATKGDITQNFADQAMESRLVESAADELADPLRALRLEQSRAFSSQLDSVLQKAGTPEDVGESIKSALGKRKALLTSEKNELYEKVFSQSDDVYNIPVMTSTISDAIPSPRELRRLSRIKGNQGEAVDDLLVEFGILKDPDKVEAFLDSGGEIDLLKVGNFEEFRQALNQIQRADTTGSTSVIIGPIKKALDAEGELIDEAIQRAGITDGAVMSTIKKARKRVTQIKKEFSPQSITGKLINVKTDGVSEVVEASSVFKELMGGQKAPELVDRTVKLLLKSPGGKKAIGNLQAATVLDLLDNAFKASTRKINNEKVFGATAFNARLKQIGDKRLESVFANNKTGLAKLKLIGKTTEDLVPPSGAVPKGSATVILDQLNKLGIISIMNNIPGSTAVIETIKTLSEKSSNRTAINTALDAKPDVKRIANFIADDFPGLASVLGIGYLTAKEDKPEATN